MLVTSPCGKNTYKPSALVDDCAALHWSSVDKTKVMVVSKPSTMTPPAVAAVFTCDGRLVEHVDTYK